MLRQATPREPRPPRHRRRLRHELELRYGPARDEPDGPHRDRERRDHQLRVRDHGGEQRVAGQSRHGGTLLRGRRHGGAARGRRRAMPIEIGDDVWLAGRVMVRPGSRIGAGAVIGAGSVVDGIPAGRSPAARPRASCASVDPASAPPRRTTDVTSIPAPVHGCRQHGAAMRSLRRSSERSRRRARASG